MRRLLAQLGRRGIEFFARLGRRLLLLLRILAGTGALFRDFPLLIRQLYGIGVRSVVIVSLSGFFVGMVLSLQGYTVLSQFGAKESLGILVAASLVRELGPVVTALLVAGRAGSALTAEIGLMKTTEQLAALEMMAVDPIRRVLVPRFFGGLLAMPLLAGFFSAFGILGGYLVGVDLLGVDAGAFWGQMQQGIDCHKDLCNGVLKSLVFGWVVIWIALFEGYDSLPTSEGVGYATTRTVVQSALTVLCLDFILTALLLGV